MDAMERARELFKIPQGELPKPAFNYMRYLCNKYMVCGEVCLTALSHYAQEIEGLPCNDDLYQIDDEGKAWFADSNGIESDGKKDADAHA